jgi:hypothetical protein
MMGKENGRDKRAQKFFPKLSPNQGAGAQFLTVALVRLLISQKVWLASGSVSDLPFVLSEIAMPL